MPASTLPRTRTDVPDSLAADVVDGGGDRLGTTPGDHGQDAPAATASQPEGEACQGDRALHAMLARLSGGISPVALLLAYTDWLSHLATSPQRQIGISQEALLGAKRLSEAARHSFAPGQG